MEYTKEDWNADVLRNGRRHTTISVPKDAFQDRNGIWIFDVKDRDQYKTRPETFEEWKERKTREDKQ